MRIHTYEQNEWTIKGKYETAVEDDEDILWMKINKEYVLPMWLVSVPKKISISFLMLRFWN
jgi:hypothetical protein